MIRRVPRARRDRLRRTAGAIDAAIDLGGLELAGGLRDALTPA
jgi:hypothetical protein